MKRKRLLGIAASAGYRVGYSDAAYFNREYKKLFGIPPIRDRERLREAEEETAGSRAEPALLLGR